MHPIDLDRLSDSIPSDALLELAMSGNMLARTALIQRRNNAEQSLATESFSTVLGRAGRDTMFAAISKLTADIASLPIVGKDGLSKLADQQELERLSTKHRRNTLKLKELIFRS